MNNNESSNPILENTSKVTTQYMDKDNSYDIDRKVMNIKVCKSPINQENFMEKNGKSDVNFDMNKLRLFSDIKASTTSDNDISDNTNINQKINDISEDCTHQLTIQASIELPKFRRNLIFCVFLLSNLFLNYDTGVIPASLLHISKELKLDYKEQAMIGSFVYLGLSLASIFVGFVFTRFRPSKVCSVVLMGNCLSCLVFSFATHKIILFSTRLLMGITEAFIVIYGPVWVNNYSPDTHSATWMGILHSCTALGVVLGYVVASLFLNFSGGILGWRNAIQVQGIVEIFFAVFFWLENDQYINVDVRQKVEANEVQDTDLKMMDFMSYNKDMENKRNFTVDKNIKEFNRKKDNCDLSNINEVDEANECKNENDNGENYGRCGVKTIKLNLPNPNYNFATPAKKSSQLSPKQLFKMLNSGLDSKMEIKRYNSTIGKYKRFDPRIDVIHTNDLTNYILQAKQVLSNPLYITITLGLCSIYFIVTGMQFWMTEYLIDILQNDAVTVSLALSVTSITAPLAGVLVGGTAADQYGGYKGQNTAKALKMCIAFGFISFVFAFPMGFLFQMVYLIVLLWTFLFFGAAIIPVGTGVMISTAPKECQATSSSISQLIFNLGGYFLAPMLTGTVMDRIEPKRTAFIWGMRLIFWWVTFPLIFVLISYYLAEKAYKKTCENSASESSSMISEEELGQEMTEIMRLEIRRRLAQTITYL